MANSTRDPLWRAVVSAEIAAAPSRQREIETTCLRCHAPMAAEVGLSDHDTGSLMHLLKCESNLGELAIDGVSCTICHGMDPDNLGTEESYSGGFELDKQRRLFGPHQDPFTHPMQMHVDFMPTYGEHITSSALCGSCHTLETEALDPDGRDSGKILVEQAPYLEWLNSAFNDEQEAAGPLAASCQDCHMPTRDVEGAKIATRIARNPGGRDFPPVDPREPFGRHVLVGGNTLVLGMLRDHREELGVTATPAALEATIEATSVQLRTRTARLSVGALQSKGRELRFHVDVENLTGHKFPTAHPTRRAWLQVVVKDGDGKVLFASGRPDERGRIVDGQGVLLASELAGGPIEAHHDLIRSSRAVATFESKMGDVSGEPTHLLLRGASYLKDNRLLPKGWSAKHAEAKRTWPTGTEKDDTFKAGGDRVHYAIDLSALPSPTQVSVHASLLYQPLGARWATELFRYSTPEVERFKTYYEAANLTPEVVATAPIKKLEVQ